MNKFYNDAILYMRKALKSQSSIPDDEDTIIFFLSFALGLERIFKGILFDISPIYILREQAFKNSAHILYKEKFVKSANKNKGINLNATGELIGFRDSLSMASYFSKTVLKHNSLFFEISKYRDIIAHRALDDLDVLRLRDILNKELRSILYSFSNELGLQGLSGIIGIKEYNDFTDTKLNELDKSLNKKLKHHKEIWLDRKIHKDQVTIIKEKTSSYSNPYYSNFSFMDVTCPACQNTAIITLEDADEAYVANFRKRYSFVTELRCFYCDLVISDSSELDYLGIGQSFFWDEEKSEDDLQED